MSKAKLQNKLKAAGVPFEEGATEQELKVLLKTNKTDTKQKAKDDKNATETQAKADKINQDKIDKIKKDAIDEHVAKADEEKKKIEDQLEKEIKEIQAKKFKTPEEAQVLGKKLQERAQNNKNKPRDVNKLFPSQMTLKEMEKYCEDNEIECEKGDSTVMLRLRIKAFRNPAQADRVAIAEAVKQSGRIVR